MKKILMQILKKYKFKFLLVLICLAIYEITRYMPMRIIGDIIDYIGDIDNTAKIVQEFIMLFSYIAIYFVTKTLFKYYLKFIMIHIGSDLREKVFKKFLNLKLKEMQNIKNGELMSYVTKYVKDIRMGISSIIRHGIRAILAGGFVLIFMININTKLTVLVLIPIIIDAFLINFLKDKVKNSEKCAQKEYTKMSEFVQENTDSIRTIKAFNGEEQQIDTFEKKSENVKNQYIQVGVYSAYLLVSMEICFGICYAISIIYGTNLIVSSVITIGDFIAFNAFLREVYWPLSWLPQLITKIKKMQVAYNKLNELYSIEEEKLTGYLLNEQDEDIEKNIIQSEKNEVTGDIEIKDLSYEFNTNKKVLNDINLKIKYGETLGIIGTIGSGKSTIANLLLRLYDVDKNKIFIGGKDINEIDIQKLRDSFCYITQENFIFSNSIKENISLFNKSYDIKEIIESSKNACLTEDLKEMKDGIETLVGEKGITLSGGQKQRVAIARAFLSNKNFVIFDDTFSAIDNKTEKNILENLKVFLKNKTSIIISNRISDVKDADKIIVLDQGKIVQEGKHKELLEREGLYRNFYNEQSSNNYLKEILV